MSIPQSDVSRPSALPTASLLQSRTSTAARLAQSQAQNSAQYLDDIEEEWNKKVDTEIETLVDGMVDIVSLASVSRPSTLNLPRERLTAREIRDKDKFRMAQEAFQTQCRAESMVRELPYKLTVFSWSFTKRSRSRHLIRYCLSPIP